MIIRTSRSPEKTGSILSEAKVVASTFNGCLSPTICYKLVCFGCDPIGCAHKRDGGGGRGDAWGAGAEAERLTSAFQRLWWNDGKAVWLRIWKALNSFRTTLQPILWHLNFESLDKTSQELRMLSLSRFFQGSLWMFRFLFSIVRNVTSVTKATSLWDCSLRVFLQLSLSLSFSLYLSLSLSFC